MTAVPSETLTREALLTHLTSKFGWLTDFEVSAIDAVLELLAQDAEAIGKHDLHNALEWYAARLRSLRDTP